ncbi:MAG: extensin family protein [Deltaproteobacteria bacterium]|nr:extensin family protein [Deltaproteobacteria bacterium]
MFRPAVLLIASLCFAGVASAQPQPKKALQSKTAKKVTGATKTASKTKPTKAKPTAKGTKKTASKSAKSTKGKVAAKTAKTGKRGKREPKVPWIPNDKTLSNAGNMPMGFTWPPTQAMVEAEKDCEAKLDRAGVVWDRKDREGRIVNAVVVPSMTFGNVKYTNMWGSKGPFVMDCQLALALETIGPELHALGVREVKFGSLFRWSNVRSGGVTKPFLSRHSLGLAMDIGSFIDDTGRQAVIKRDYKMDDQLLHGIEQLINANGNFRIVLTPKNDPISHDDHFHIEAKANYTSPDVR